MSASSLPINDIRQMVRSILREALPELIQTRPTTETVTIRSDDDLRRFIIRLLGLFEDQSTREAIRSGAIGFTLSEQDFATQAPTASANVTELSGAVSERKLLSFAKPGDTVALTADAVLTPLARDKARTLNITLIRRG